MYGLNILLNNTTPKLIERTNWHQIWSKSRMNTQIFMEDFGWVYTRGYKVWYTIKLKALFIRLNATHHTAVVLRESSVFFARWISIAVRLSPWNDLDWYIAFLRQGTFQALPTLRKNVYKHDYEDLSAKSSQVWVLFSVFQCVSFYAVSLMDCILQQEIVLPLHP